MSHHASMFGVATLTGLEQALNAALALDPKTGERLARLEGRTIALELSGTGIRLYLQPHAGGLRLMGHFDGKVDTTLHGAPFSLLRMGSGRTGEGLFRGGVEIEGDVELGTRFQRIFEKLDIDWEEHLSRLTGDIIAHQLGNSVRGLFAWGERSIDHLGEDIADYLQEEREVLPVDWEVEGFITDVDTLRSDVDRLAARVKRLVKLLESED
ncbi:MAG: SCP2 sterol-binding domain-containing protein [Gammaproteobacteria bacterium]|nr:SCP2 sterol-binding domain-containing protein [Gammaproteobacteria bacterium]